MRTNTALVLAGLLLFAGCSKPVDTVIPSNMDTWDKELGPVTQKLSEEDRKLFAGYVVRMKMASAFKGDSSDIPFGTTIGQALEDQRKWLADMEREQAEEKAKSDREEAERMALKQKIEAERASQMEAINGTVTVTLVSKNELARNFQAGRYSDQQQFVIGAENKSQKTIVGVSGELEFVDLFGKVVGAVNFRMSEKIEPGKTARWTGVRDYNQFIPEQRAVWGLEDGKYTTKFTPEAVVFSDGDKLAMPQ